ncbi:MAG TPA: PAS domain-containing protein, partial [Noviherbaspirillum sp.]|nr:PAS domain-containing protein [Noviherbaspirillum sp.]
ETGKEELQSSNQELQTVNDQLKLKLEEAAKANDDLNNLIASSDVATLFLDREMRILRYTPRIADIFNVIAADVGRPLRHITSRLDNPQLAEEAAGVFDTLQPLEREARSRDGRHYIVRVHPYRTNDDRIAGAVMSFFDITSRRAAEQALRENEARLRTLLTGFAQIFWETDAEGKVVEDSPSWRAYTGQTLEEWLGDGWLHAVHPDDRAQTLHEWREAVAARRDVNTEFRLRRADGVWRRVNVRAVPLYDSDGTLLKWVGMNIDIEQRRRVGDRRGHEETHSASQKD